MLPSFWKVVRNWPMTLTRSSAMVESRASQYKWVLRYSFVMLYDARQSTTTEALANAHSERLETLRVGSAVAEKIRSWWEVEVGAGATVTPSGFIGHPQRDGTSEEPAGLEPTLQAAKGVEADVASKAIPRCAPDVA